jgi:hypothetical protein
LKIKILDVTLTLFIILVSLNTFASNEVNSGNEKLVSMEMKISSLSESIHDLSNRQQELNKTINESRSLQLEINATASNLVTFFEAKYSNNKPIPIEISQPVNWYPYLLPLITIFIVIATTYVSIRTIKIKSQESLSALENSNETLVSINNKSILEEHNRSQKTIITKNRQEWINSLRDEITLFLAVIASTSPSQTAQDVPSDDMKNLWVHSYKIELLINQKEDDHKELVRLIREEISNLNTSNESTLTSTIISLSQKILKREWNRVKGFEDNS